MEIRLRDKYTRGKGTKSHKRNNRNGNNTHSAGKHTAHPDVFGYRRDGYTCDPKWNVKPREESQ